MPPLSSRHHTLIQALLSRGPLREADFLSMFSDITGMTSDSQNQLFKDYLRRINEELSYAQFELRACRNQFNGEVYYGVVNNASDDQSKLGTKYTLPQIAFYKGIVEAIIHDSEARGCISSTDALYVQLDMQVKGTSDSYSQEGGSQLPSAFTNFPMSLKETTLQQLIKDNWLCSLPEGNIGIGVRSFLDLRTWFQTNEVPACDVCNEAAVKAQVCHNEACNVRFHLYCLKVKFFKQKVKRVCPGCGLPWPLIPWVKAEEQELDDHIPSQNATQPSEPPTKLKRKRDQVNNLSQTTTGTSDTKRTTRTSSRLAANFYLHELIIIDKKYEVKGNFPRPLLTDITQKPESPH